MKLLMLVVRARALKERCSQILLRLLKSQRGSVFQAEGNKETLNAEEKELISKAIGPLTKLVDHE